MRSRIAVDAARPEHATAIAGLLGEIDRFYGATEPESPEQRMRHVHEALFSSRPTAFALLALDGERLVGLAAYSFLWPAAGSTRSLFLKELYVADGYRGKGVGRLLMERLCQVALQHRCTRVEWTTDADNPGALRFYEALGLAREASKFFYRVSGEALRNLAEGQ